MANCASADIVFAADTFLIRGDTIAVQTFAARIEPKGEYSQASSARNSKSAIV